MRGIACVVGAGLAVVVAACGGGNGPPIVPVEINPGSTLTFSPSAVTATRFPDGCGSASPPPYGDADTFGLDVIGAQNPVPRTALGLDVSRTVSVGSPYSLVISPVVASSTGPSSSAQNADAADGTLDFQLAWGANASELDPNPLDSVTVTVVAFPARDGDPLTVHYVLHFTDAQTLDATFSAPMVTSYSSGCPAG